jgi:DUF2914 family protein
MKKLWSAVVLGLATTTALAAQDTTKAQAPAAAPPAAPAAISVEAVVTRGVTANMPQDTLTTAAADVGTLVLWTRLSGGAGQAVHHVWFHGDTQVADVELQVGGSPWRTWSRKTIPADWTGAWHVEIRDAGGAVLKRVDFTVGQ